MRRLATLSLLGFALLLAPSLRAGEAPKKPDRKAAEQHNSQGMHAYDAREYDGAAESFLQAMEADPTWAIPPFNRACALALHKQHNDRCAVERSEILDLVELSIKLDARRRKKAKSDSDLTIIRDSVRYQLLIGRSITKDLAVILDEVSWYGPSPGVYGPMAGIDFDGELVKVWQLKIDDEGTPSKRHRKGTWRVVGKKVVITIDGKEMTGTLSAEGTLTIEGLGTFTDDGSECGV